MVHVLILLSTVVHANIYYGKSSRKPKMTQSGNVDNNMYESFQIFPFNKSGRKYPIF